MHILSIYLSNYEPIYKFVFGGRRKGVGVGVGVVVLYIDLSIYLPQGEEDD